MQEHQQQMEDIINFHQQSKTGWIQVINATFCPLLLIVSKNIHNLEFNIQIFFLVDYLVYILPLEFVE